MGQLQRAIGTVIEYAKRLAEYAKGGLLLAGSDVAVCVGMGIR